MNIFTCTGKILNCPRFLNYKHKPYIYFFIALPNRKKGSLVYYICVKAKGKLASKIFDLYLKGDLVIVQGHVSIRLVKQYIRDRKLKEKKNLIIKIYRIDVLEHGTKYKIS